jgi:prepilin-type N-terminal cleavage/methylation domain-containing protein
MLIMKPELTAITRTDRMKSQIAFDAKAFTLIELLVVIAIIGILAAMLLPVIGRVKTKVQVSTAQTAVGQIVGAIADYDSHYSQMPSTKGVVTSSIAANNEDFTYGTYMLGGLKVPAPGAPQAILSPNIPGFGGIQGIYQTNNAEMMAVLLDLERYGNGADTVNKGHVRNTLHTPLLPVKRVSDTTSAGVGLDGVYRDPWGNPFIISIDLNNDGKCRDAFYRLHSVSRKQPGSPTGLNGLFNAQDPTGASDDYEYNGHAMAWSAGPDGMIDPTVPANQGENRDNVLSWK